jgi:hypothetical protein
MPKNAAPSAALVLIESGTLAKFEVTSTNVEPVLGDETLCVRIEMQLGDPEDEDDDPEREVEWAGLGFMYVLALRNRPIVDVS